ncbi:MULTISPECIES: bifunctional 4-hydroxy-2-oxoglutarate aldolase/2-dehydro-3-deoxy-phosphogluconate aldolase [Bacillaceae]|uniref:bifunctional 4-hydroxy-2-oxoglutarate aldolase/2-dehydro-3-deoxy-phosphogluconate aldolase n=1 Tax=Bacillaceae TaxID=186817 RepID=UPI001E622EF4|nr:MULTISPECIES: bifunctional 4-hydroxy-2-oxoglutarate aldolase/2-dehydro-3-deoxy-phosphogluconate aldolase [Bacillaceae]MCE4047479.1 bifunctional 4-hydroxy-2-oxoglutarate aldolase/2-dehydro-3-deoxy-phosphogluconate aldolase [Bacillus sp. Au-Bac7]MCM3030755.1 bifunctional 4-hydroxy-2-oxoglutarate aldolase/2-dehydro-3-deoxy-phosphogluconate aldolase [Niallia sp. MER 6]MDL0435826.1 bifunctional 4-hydroxy-2-oxoglutarate aldolase/2-dehydro-3-deoxy-phosphogluconate aldolase [Niallia sp. SS-2023]UPO8
MNKANTLSVLTDCGVVAVIRADTPEEAVQTSIACVDGGITGIEVTFTVKDAEKAIRELVESYRNNQDVVIGAGTVLDGHTARLAIMAGAQFIVSPCFDKETAKLCNLYQIPYMPGCMTVTEMKQALEYGADIIKLFPGSAFGPDYVKAVKAPLPHVNIMPTGGVSLENIHEWIENGCAAVGVGGNLVAPAKEGNFEQVTAYARQYVEKVKEARGKAQ